MITSERELESVSMKTELSGQLKSLVNHTNMRIHLVLTLSFKKGKNIFFLNSFSTQIKLSLLSCQEIYDNASQISILQKPLKMFSREVLKVSLYLPCEDIRKT